MKKHIKLLPCCIYGILWRACNLTSFSPCLTGPVDYLFASRHKGPRFKSPRGYLCETGILLLALSRYIADTDVIDHHGLVWGGLCPKPSLGPRANNVIIPLDLTQLFCPGSLPMWVWKGQRWQDCQDMTVASGEQSKRWPGQGNWNRTAGKGKSGQNRTDGSGKESWTGHLGLDNRDRTAELGQIRQVGLMCNLDRTARTWQCLENIYFRENVYQKKILVNIFTKLFGILIVSPESILAVSRLPQTRK
jgi:hypothetical protein